MFPGLESALPELPGAPWLSKAAEEVGYQSRAVSSSAGFPERRGVPPRPVGPGPAYTNTGRKQRSLDSMKRSGTVETSGSTRKRETMEGEERALTWGAICLSVCPRPAETPNATEKSLFYTNRAKRT
eukprot:superscaffoldBa00001340_g10134